MTQFPVPSRTTNPAILAAGVVSVLIHAGLGLGLANYGVPTSAGQGDMDLGVEILLPADGTGLAAQQSPQSSQLSSTETAAKVDPSQVVPVMPVAPLELLRIEPQPPPEPGPEEDLVRIGTDDGVGRTDNMLGAAQATPHSAIIGSVDQPALTLAPGLPGPSGVGAPERSSDASDAGEGGANGQTGGSSQVQPASPQASVDANPQPAQPEQPQTPAAEPAPETKIDLAEQADASLKTDVSVASQQPTPAQQSEPVKNEVSPEVEVRATDEPSIFEQANGVETDSQENVFAIPQPQKITAVDEFGQQAAPAVAGKEVPVVVPPEAAPAEVKPAAVELPAKPKSEPPAKDQARLALSPVPVEPASTSPAATSAAPGAAGSPATAGGDSRLPGTTSDAESTAVSTQPLIDFKPGMPLTGKGIRIRTVVPRFSTTTQLTAMPRNPVIVIRFNRAGRVVKAEFEGLEGTGYSGIDEPLLDAVYRWTAVGEQLNRLPANSKETISFRIRYLLKDE